MKRKSPAKWYVEWNKDYRLYQVKKDGFCDSTYNSKYLALQRIVELEEIDEQDSII